MGNSSPTPPPIGNTAWRMRVVLLATALVLVGLAASAIDIPVARLCKAGRPPGELLKLINFSETFAHSLGVAAVLATVLVLDPTLRRERPAWRGEFARMVVATYVGGLVVDVVKLLVPRVRPRAADLAAVQSAWATFGESTLAVEHRHLSDIMSFPSGHSAVAAGLAATLCWRYPHGLPAFATVAALAAAQRVVTSQHYPSDVAIGAACGLLGAACVLRTRSRRDVGVGMTAPRGP